MEVAARAWALFLGLVLMVSGVADMHGAAVNSWDVPVLAWSGYGGLFSGALTSHCSKREYAAQCRLRYGEHDGGLDESSARDNANHRTTVIVNGKYRNIGELETRGCCCWLAMAPFLGVMWFVMGLMLYVSGIPQIYGRLESGFVLLVVGLLLPLMTIFTRHFIVGAQLFNTAELEWNNMLLYATAVASLLGGLLLLKHAAEDMREREQLLDGGNGKIVLENGAV